MDFEEKQARQTSICQKAADIINKFPAYKDLLTAFYGSKIVTDDIDFDPDGIADIVDGSDLSYDDYITAQINSVGKRHDILQWEPIYNCKAQVEKIVDKRIYFQDMLVATMSLDGSCWQHLVDHVYRDVIDHIWMDKKGFKKLHLQPGDCVTFLAERYRYLLESDGEKQIHYGLRGPSNIQKIDDYRQPTKDGSICEEIGYRKPLCLEETVPIGIAFLSHTIGGQ